MLYRTDKDQQWSSATNFKVDHPQKNVCVSSSGLRDKICCQINIMGPPVNLSNLVQRMCKHNGSLRWTSGTRFFFLGLSENKWVSLYYFIPLSRGLMYTGGQDNWLHQARQCIIVRSAIAENDFSWHIRLVPLQLAVPPKQNIVKQNYILNCNYDNCLSLPMLVINITAKYWLTSAQRTLFNTHASQNWALCRRL